MANHFRDRREAELVKARNSGRDHPERESSLTTLRERAATEAGPVEPGEREVNVLLYVENRLLPEVRSGRTRLSISRPDKIGAPSMDEVARLLGSVGAESPDKEEVGALLIPEDLEPRCDRLDIDAVHWIASFKRRMDAKEPGPRAGLFGSIC